MPDDRPNEQEIFEIARQIDALDARRAYLNEACHGDSALLQRVSALLAAFEKDDSFLESPPTDLQVAVTLAQPSSEQAGGHVGPYKLLQQIGEGGMGTVYMAEQTKPVRRRVALKIIKPGMDSRQVIARFEAERQALAMMDHPNIAKVLDAGTTDSGRPYFVMELVKGIPITQYCDEKRLTTRARLELFVPILHAIQHAHQKGVIHRDLKPSNVMVAEYDNHASPKVIDFGVAKATSQQLTEKTVFTEYGQVVGTLEYMSPEQAKLNQLDIDTRSDIYSAGVLLYELLIGTTPIDRERLRTVAFDEMLRIIREEEAPRPSTRLTTVNTLPTVAANRSTEPSKLGQSLRGELDWIVMKALDKDRGRRFETAGQFADDIRRYLDGEPVDACPPTAAYRFRKFAQRNKASLAIATVAIVALVALAIASTVAAGRFRILAQSNAKLASEKTTALGAEQDAHAAALEAKDEASRRLFDSYLAQARASRWSGRPGQRFDAEEAIEHAAALLDPLKLREDARMQLRNELIAAVSLPDVKKVATWSGPINVNRASCLSPDLSLFCFEDREEKLIRVRTTEKPEEDLAVFAHASIVGLRISRDNKWLMIIGKTPANNAIWSLESGEKSFEFLDGGPEEGIALSTDSRLLAVGYDNSLVRFFELQTGREVASFNVGGNEVPRMSFSPGGRRIAVWSWPSNVIELRDVASGELLDALPLGETREIWKIAWDPRGRWLAAGLRKFINIWDLTNPQRAPRRVPGHESIVNSLQFHPSGSLLLSSSWDGTARIWESATGFQVLQMECSSPVFSADGRAMATRHGLEFARWEVALPVGIQWIYANEVSYAADVGQDGRLLALGFGNGLRLYDLDVKRQVAHAAIGRVRGVRFRQDDGTMVTSSTRGVYVWPLQRRLNTVSVGPPQLLDSSLQQPMQRLDISRNGRVVAAETEEPGSHRIILVRQADGESVPNLANVANTLDKSGARLDHSASVTSGDSLTTAGANRDDSSRSKYKLKMGGLVGVALSPDGKWVAAGNWKSRGVAVWNAITVKPHVLPANASTLVGFSPDSRLLVANGGEAVRVWNVPSWDLRYSFPAYSDVPSPVAFSNDGSMFALARRGLGMHLVDTESGEPIVMLATNQRRPHFEAVCFSPDDRMLIVSRGEAGVCVWDLAELRRRLAGLGLDWDRPQFPPRQANESSGPMQVTVDLGALDKDWKTRDEEKARLVQKYYYERRWDDAARLALERIAVMDDRKAIAPMVLTASVLLFVAGETDEFEQLRRQHFHQWTSFGDTWSDIRICESALVGWDDGPHIDKVLKLTDEQLAVVTDSEIASILHMMRALAHYIRGGHKQMSEELELVDHYELDVSELLRCHAFLHNGDLKEARRILLNFTAYHLEDARPVSPEASLHFSQSLWSDAIEQFDVRPLVSWARKDAVWEIARLPEVKCSNADAKVALQEDGSCLLIGPTQKGETYTISFRSPVERVTAIRIENLCDDRLPYRGPGRSPANGRFSISKIELTRSTSEGGASVQTAQWSDAISLDTASPPEPVFGPIDDNPETEWGVLWGPNGGYGMFKPHAAAFTLAEPLELSEGDTLTLTIHCDSHFPHHANHVLGRFRIAVTNSDAPKIENE